MENPAKVFAMRSVRPGSIQSAVRGSITAAGGLECVSNDLGVSVTTLSRATDLDEERPGGLGVNHLHRLGLIVSISAEPLARHFASLAGGFYHPIDIKTTSGADMASLTLQFSKLLAVYADAQADHSALLEDYASDSAERALSQIDELIATAATIRATLAGKVVQ